MYVYRPTAQQWHVMCHVCMRSCVYVYTSGREERTAVSLLLWTWRQIVVDMSIRLAIVVTAVSNGWQCWRRSNVVLLAVLVTHLTRTSLISTMATGGSPRQTTGSYIVSTTSAFIPTLLNLFILYVVLFLIFSCCLGYVCRVYYCSTVFCIHVTTGCLLSVSLSVSMSRVLRNQLTAFCEVFGEDRQHVTKCMWVIGYESP